MGADDRAAWGLSPKDGRSLTRFVERTRGHGFKLAVVEVATAGQRARVLAGLQGLLGEAPLLTVALDQLPGENLWDELRARFPTPAPDGLLALWGLEEAGNRTEVLMQQLNVQRDLFVRDLRVPWVLFLHPGLATRLRSRAPDFCDLAILWVDMPAMEIVRPLGETSRGAVDAGGQVVLDDTAVRPLLHDAASALGAWRLDAAADLLGQYQLQGDGSPTEDWYALVLRGRLSRVLGDIPSARAQFQRALAHAEEFGQRWLRAIALFCLGALEDEQGNLRVAQRLLSEAAAIDQQDTAADPSLVILLRLASVEMVLGHPSEARRQLMQVQQIAERIADQSALAMVWYQLARLEMRSGEFQRARRLLKAGLRVNRRLVDHGGQAGCLRMLAELALAEDNTQEAYRRLKEVLALEARTGHREGRASTLKLQGILASREGRLKEARPLLEEALRLMETSGDRQGRGVVLQELAHLEHHLGNLEGARRLQRESLQIAVDVGWRAQEASALVMLGQYEFMAGNESEGRALLQQAIALLEKLGSPHLAQARAVLASLRE